MVILWKIHKRVHLIVQVVVLDSVGPSYKVLVNEKDIKFVPNDKNQIPAEEIFKVVLNGIRRSIENNNFKNQPLKEQPNDSSENVQLPYGQV